MTSDLDTGSNVLRENDGGTVAVTEEEIVQSSLELADMALYVEPSCSHAAAGFSQLITEDKIDPDDETVIIRTGNDLKATSFYDDQFS